MHFLAQHPEGGDGREEALCTVLCGKLECLAFQDHLSTLSAALRHPIGFLVTCLASSKSPFLYIFHMEKYVVMEIERGMSRFLYS